MHKDSHGTIDVGKYEEIRRVFTDAGLLTVLLPGIRVDRRHKCDALGNRVFSFGLVYRFDLESSVGQTHNDDGAVDAGYGDVSAVTS